MTIKLLNKGTADAENVKAILSPLHNYVRIINRESDLRKIRSGEEEPKEKEFSYNIDSDGVEIDGFILEISAGKKGKWRKSFEVLLFDDLPEFNEYKIADGREVPFLNISGSRQLILTGIKVLIPEIKCSWFMHRGNEIRN